MAWRQFEPKLITAFREGYGIGDLRADAVSGLTVAIVALPLAMALGIASGATPDKGLLTAVVAGFVISALGGSRVQIGGPTGAFVVVVANTIATHGYDGLVLATLMAGLILLVAGFARLGTWIKYIPEPVVTGFTAGIAVIIFSSQIKDLFGLTVPEVPAEVAEKWGAFWATRDTMNIAAVALSAASLAIIIGLRKFAPRLPGFLLAVIAASCAAMILDLKVDTIGSAFGGVPTAMPAPVLPDITFARLQDLMPSAFTIAFLAGVESLLSAMVADGMTGRRHRSNAELVAQGVANTASALFGGMPATGAIARTATNIRSGARSPMSGMFHAVFLLAFMLLLAPLLAYIPLAALAGVLVMVAWNMADIPRFLHLMNAPVGDRIVLILTFALTVLVDLTVAIEVGVVLASFLFMHRMAEVAGARLGATGLLDDDEDDDTAPAIEDPTQRVDLPPGVDVFQMRGPLFFGVTHRLAEVLGRTDTPPRVFIIRMRRVPLVDSSGASALGDLINRYAKHGSTVILSGVQNQPRQVLTSMGIKDGVAGVQFARDYAESLEISRRITDTAT
ncbi:MAG: STAS domain-containing protein [Rhodobacteraceae bacterium]|nr:STAS domain-containing protein [Paracoccaceae bacterium]